MNKKQRPPKTKPSLRLNALAMAMESSSDVPSSSSTGGDLPQPKQAHIQFMNKEQQRKGPSNEKKCVVCKHKHPVAYCPAFRSKHLQER